MNEEGTNPVEETTEVEAQPTAEVQAPTEDPGLDQLTTLHERTIAALSYVSFLAIVPFYLKKDSEFCRFHGKQGMLIAIVFFLVQLFAILDIIADIAILAQFIYFVLGGYAAVSGRWKKMPLIYDWSCQLEKALSLKTKEEEESDKDYQPDTYK